LKIRRAEERDEEELVDVAVMEKANAGIFAAEVDGYSE
jgi:hypothetical protein